MKLRLKKPKPDPEDKAAMEEWQVEFTETVVIELYELIKKQEDAYGPEVGDQIRLGIVAAMISTFVFEILADAPVEASAQMFRDVKEAVEIAVASGFQGALQTLFGEGLEYSCQLSPELETVNKTPF